MDRKRRSLLTLSEQQEMLLFLRVISAEFRSNPHSLSGFDVQIVNGINSLVSQTQDVELVTLGNLDHAPLHASVPASRTTQGHQDAPCTRAPERSHPGDT